MKQRIITVTACLFSLVFGIAYLKSQSTNAAPAQSGGITRTQTNVVKRVIRRVEEYEEIVVTVAMTRPWWNENGMWITGKVEYAIQPEEIVSRTLKTNVVNAPSQ